jgi:hypothetical protein
MVSSGATSGASRATSRAHLEPDRAAVDERLRAEIAWVSWPPWGDRQSELFYDIYSSHADLMRGCYRATHGYVQMVWDGRRWLQQVDGQWVGV